MNLMETAMLDLLAALTWAALAIAAGLAVWHLRKGER